MYKLKAKNLITAFRNIGADRLKIGNNPKQRIWVPTDFHPHIDLSQESTAIRLKQVQSFYKYLGFDIKLKTNVNTMPVLVPATLPPGWEFQKVEMNTSSAPPQGSSCTDLVPLNTQQAPLKFPINMQFSDLIDPRTITIIDLLDENKRLCLTIQYAPQASPWNNQTYVKYVNEALIYRDMRNKTVPSSQRLLPPGN